MLEGRIDYSNYQVVISLISLRYIIMYSYYPTSFKPKFWIKYPSRDRNYLTAFTSVTYKDVH